MKNQDTNWMQIFPLYIPGKKTKKQKLVQLREKKPYTSLQGPKQTNNTPPNPRYEQTLYKRR